MTRFGIRLKLLLKFVFVNNFRKFKLGSRSGVGMFSKIMFSSQMPDQSITIGKNAGVGRFCELHVWGNNHIHIKDYSTLNDGCKILGDVIVEKYCLLSANIFASSGNHYSMIHPAWLLKDQDNYMLSTETGRNEHSKPIRIEEDVWIGYGVFIKQNVKIGRGAIVGANSVVTKNLFPYTIYAGVPCREIAKRLEFTPPSSLSNENDLHIPYFYRGFDHKRNADFIKEKDVMLSESQSIAILSADKHVSVIHITGKKNSVVKNCNLEIVWQGKYSWNVNLNSDKFELNLCLNQATTKPSVHSHVLYNSIADNLREYNIITFYSKNIAKIDFPFGISSIFTSSI